ncbi:hypothetical protein GsuE55_10370 [Geobacillus subterraneus]|uniref:Uncharacterized protein n=1 Tax=Geobacillus subterraneus TaxID=129338 RepID=A0A679FTX3_9BACL|nr:hypothetical protein GsuE55_10370 [Geobacillus subterraneus]
MKKRGWPKRLSAFKIGTTDHAGEAVSMYIEQQKRDPDPFGIPSFYYISCNKQFPIVHFGSSKYKLI